MENKSTFLLIETLRGEAAYWKLVAQTRAALIWLALIAGVAIGAIVRATAS